MPTAQPTRVAVEIGADQLHLGGCQSLEFKLQRLLVSQANRRVRFVQRQGQPVQKPLVEPIP
ncbi:hypothetical protein D9M68_959810 [compost metagenome]